MDLDRQQALAIVSHGLDDSLAVRAGNPVPEDATLVVFDKDVREGVPMVVAVWSHLPGCHVDAEEATDIACDYLNEIHWPHTHDGAVIQVFEGGFQDVQRPRS